MLESAILIAHRGNTMGRNEQRENDPLYLQEAIANGFRVEVDIWFVDGKLMLGHDSPQYEVGIKFIEGDNFWCHAKNKEALFVLSQNKSVNVFWHENDKFTLTSWDDIWTYPGNFTEGCIINQFEWFMQSLPMNEENARNTILSISQGKPFKGVCSDWVGLLKTE